MGVPGLPIPEAVTDVVERLLGDVGRPGLDVLRHLVDTDLGLAGQALPVGYRIRRVPGALLLHRELMWEEPA